MKVKNKRRKYCKLRPIFVIKLDKSHSIQLNAFYVIMPCGVFGFVNINSLGKLLYFPKFLPRTNFYCKSGNIPNNILSNPW